MWDLFNAAWFGTLVGTLLGVAGLWFGIFSYRRSRQITRLRYMAGHTPLIGMAPAEASDKLKILYDERPVERLTSSSFGIWNDGTTTVRGADIVERDAVGVILNSEGEILRATIEGVTRTVNNVQIVVTSVRKIVFTFDYLDPGDGFRLQLLHSGEPASASLTGSIMGLPKGIEPRTSARADLWLTRAMYGLVLFVAACGALMSLGIVAMFVYATYQAAWPRNLVYGLSLAGFTLFLIWSALPGKATADRRRIKGIPEIVTSDPSLS